MGDLSNTHPSNKPVCEKQRRASVRETASEIASEIASDLIRFSKEKFLPIISG